ncbi:MAG: hypothetical protein EA402_05060 [Planctomycetota bacterium]|nr:MAG: hypothetical protein EA402_05060 [Planctomycetota bacterium]
MLIRRLLSLTLIAALGHYLPSLAAEDAGHAALRALTEPAVAALVEAEAALASAGEDEALRTEAIAALDQASVVVGAEGWLYTLADLRHHAAGPFWGEAAAAAAAASRHQDPLPAISDFAAQVRRAGARLLVVPVPSKVLGHGEHLDPALADWEDPARSAFLAALRAAEVEVVDLLPLFRELRSQGVAVHLRGDSHWSPQAMARSAELIHSQVAAEAWLAELPRSTVEMVSQERELRGDLASRIDAPREAVKLHQVQLDGAAHTSDAASPIVLMGDSHGLVFGHRDLLATQSGLADHLAAQFRHAIDVVAVQGSGANASRATLARRRDQLAGKHLLVWVFAEREGTRSTSGWPPIPVVP